jgi:hypothetical protein
MFVNAYVCDCIFGDEYSNNEVVTCDFEIWFVASGRHVGRGIVYVVISYVVWPIYYIAWVCAHLF